MSHYRPRSILPKTCTICGIAFDATRPDARYCSAGCRKAASRLAASKAVRAAIRGANFLQYTGKTLFDQADQAEPVMVMSELDKVLDVLRAEWPDLRPWIKEMLTRLARKRKPSE